MSFAGDLAHGGNPRRDHRAPRSSCRECSANSAIYVAEAPDPAPPRTRGQACRHPEWAQPPASTCAVCCSNEYGVDLAFDRLRARPRARAGRVEKIQLRLPPECGCSRCPSTPLPACWPPARSTRRSRRATPRQAPVPRSSRARGRVLPQHRHLPDHARRRAPARCVRARPLDRDEPVRRSRKRAAQPGPGRGHRRLHKSGRLDRRPCAAWAGIAGDDFWPYGLERPAHLGSFVQYGFEQGVSKRRLKVESCSRPRRSSGRKSSRALFRCPSRPWRTSQVALDAGGATRRARRRRDRARRRR